jgi:hypothetical protein
MTSLLNNISEHIKENKKEDNLFVKNIIINKEKKSNKEYIYIPTEKWVLQLGERLQFSS